MTKYGFAKGYAQVSYERLLLTQPDFNLQGLWEKDGRYYIVCSDIATAITSDGTPLKEWFDEHCRVIAYQVDLIATPPPGATRLPARTVEQLSQLHGAPLNAVQFSLEIKRQLPKNFPKFSIQDFPDKLIFTSTKPLDPDQITEANIAVANLGLNIDTEFKTADTTPLVNAAQFASYRGRTAWPAAVLDVHDESEQRWFDTRISLFTDVPTAADVRRDSGTACFIDCSLGTPGNIRNYLTTYSDIYIAPPLGDFEPLLKHLKITSSDLRTLIERRRVTLVLPHDLHKYDPKGLAEHLELCSSNTVMHRKLAVATIQDSRRRNPLMYPPIDNESRRKLLDLMIGDAENLDRKFLRIARDHFGASWSSLEADYSTLGAVAGLQHGSARLLAEMVSVSTGQDLNPLLMYSTLSVEWSAALNANFCPTDAGGANIEAMASAAASFITGVPNKNFIDPITKLDTIISGLLVLDNTAPIHEVLDAFQAEEISRLNKILRACNFEVNATNQYISDINERVKQFEYIQNGAKKRDILGLAGALIPAALAGATGSLGILAAWIPFGVYVAQRITGNEGREGNPVTDWLKAKNTFTTSETVFISRMRKRE
nr:hypothetical protein [uncultured Pseudomonas sp.]